MEDESGKPIETRCGYVALVGRANVGKSTLLNRLVGQKLAITSRRPQTTRQPLLGISTTPQAQVLYVDTPGLQSGESIVGGERAINRYMNRSVLGTIADVDAVVLVVDRGRWEDGDQALLDAIAEHTRHKPTVVLCAVNKIDRLEQSDEVLPALSALAERFAFHELIPVSALAGTNLDRLEQCLTAVLPQGPFLFPADQVTDKDLRFLVAEIVREKLFRQLGQELPYRSTVVIDRYEEDRGLVHIDASIVVERDGQKGIVIGAGGQRLKAIGQAARTDIEALVEARVMLRLWVKVRAGWSDSDTSLRRLGLT